jgi:hypothetical protein
MKRISTYDEGALGRLLLEVSLLDFAYQRFGRNEEDALGFRAVKAQLDASIAGYSCRRLCPVRQKEGHRALLVNEPQRASERLLKSGTQAVGWLELG